MTKENMYSSYEDMHHQNVYLGLRLKRISWSAMFAGIVTTIVSLFLLSLLGLAIGFGTIDPVTEPNPLAGLGTGAIVWWIISTVVSLFLGGWVTGKLSGILANSERVINGLVMWGAFTLLSIFILTTSVGSIISGVGSILNKGVNMAGQGISSLTENGQTSSQNNGTDVQAEFKSLLRQTGKPELQPERLKKTMKKGLENPEAALDKFLSSKDALDREALVNVIMNRTGKSREEANAIVERWEGVYQEGRAEMNSKAQRAEEKARRVSDRAAETASKAALYSFFGLLLGMFASGLGAYVGKSDPYDDVKFDEPRSHGPGPYSREGVSAAERVERISPERKTTTTVR